jgi:predicted RNA binding protein YcfA (HicA-like mRNA interferase family)
MTSKELIKILKQNGWEIDRIQGSHYILKKGNQREVVPYHNTDLKPGLLNAILKRTGLK